MENYFELFGLPVSFQPDKALLRTKYVELSKRYHPDYFAQATEAAQEQALETSAQINRGYKTLTNTDATLKYVLLLRGAMKEDEAYTLPPAFLMEMLEWNEEAQEATDKEETDALRNRLSGFQKALYDAVSSDMKNFDPEHSPKQDLSRIKDYYFKKKYLDRIAEVLDARS